MISWANTKFGVLISAMCLKWAYNDSCFHYAAALVDPMEQVVEDERPEAGKKGQWWTIFA